MNVNKAILVGRITKELEIKTTTSGKTVCKFSMATNRSYKDQNGNKIEQAQFHNIILWGKLAEIAGQYLVKGQEVYIEGRIETRSYEDKMQNTRYITEIIGENMQMGSKPQGRDQEAKQASQPQYNHPKLQEEIPTIQLDDEDSGQQTFEQHQADIANGRVDEEIRVEDIPF